MTTSPRALKLAVTSSPGKLKSARRHETALPTSIRTYWFLFQWWGRINIGVLFDLTRPQQKEACLALIELGNLTLDRTGGFAKGGTIYFGAPPIWRQTQICLEATSVRLNLLRAKEAPSVSGWGAGSPHEGYRDPLLSVSGTGFGGIYIYILFMI